MQLMLHFFILEMFNFVLLMEILGYFFALVIGLIMGLIGGGGSILGVPVFVYLMKMDALTATTLSLFVVGVTSLFGAIGNAKQGNVEVKTAFIFGVPSVVSVMLMRRIILPMLPDTLVSWGHFHLDKNVFILVLFATLMLFSSYKMIKGGNNDHKTITDSPRYFTLVIQGLVVGVITGLVGAGGGFLIVPALVMLLRLDIKKAIGTSLLIISMNSLLGFAISQHIFQIDWKFLILYSILSILGMFIGMKLAKKINSSYLKTLFGWIVLLMGIYIILKELF